MLRLTLLLLSLVVSFSALPHTKAQSAGNLTGNLVSTDGFNTQPSLDSHGNPDSHG
ncbi:MAG TPA: hypothetical protein VLX28_23525 [Thermoanaerobaculia bacterium]|nr:hypothetical protein [Thermoanaerobaculia bacterium]